MTRNSLAVFALLVAPGGGARGHESCGCKPETRKDIVDFSRPPSKVEPQDKVRVHVQPDEDAKTGHLTIEVQGQAYFPDNTVIVVTARHWKSKNPFASVRVSVKEKVFTAKLGPFTKAIPAGGIVVGAFFIDNAQPPSVQKALVAEKYYKNNPPCKHDRATGAEAQFSCGGAEKEALDEKAEKEEIGAARKRLLDAKKACDDVLAEVEKKAKVNKDALDAITRLDEDLKAAATVMNKWAAGRQTFLFTNRIAQLAKLRSLIKDYARFRATAAGVTVPEFTSTNAPARKDELANEITKLSDELKGFLDDPHALDAAWEGEKGGTGGGASQPDAPPK